MNFVLLQQQILNQELNKTLNTNMNVGGGALVPAADLLKN